MHPEPPQAETEVLAAAPPSMRYEGAYVWFVFISSLDLMLTWVFLHMRGRELNPIADLVIRSAGLHGLIVFKFSLVVLVILMCETIGKRRENVGRFIARFAVGITAVPVVAGIFQFYFL
jgi:hypothetical protein